MSYNNQKKQKGILPGIASIKINAFTFPSQINDEEIAENENVDILINNKDAEEEADTHK